MALPKKERNNQTEIEILKAARKVFTQKGYAAARMEDIATEAGINRALLHYYFRNKDRMFDMIFEQRIGEFFSGLASIMNSNLDLMKKISAIVEHDIAMITAQPDLPIFIMQELTQNPQRLIDHANKVGARPEMLLKTLSAQVKTEIRKKTIRPIEAHQLLINIMSLSIYPFIAKPMIKAMNSLDDAMFDKMMKKRKVEVTNFIISAIKF